MKIDRIECFLSIAQTKNFSQSAETLHMSQPSMSRIIMLLEEELGFKLFERSSKTVELTKAGEEFYAFVKEWNEALKSKIEECKQLNMPLKLRIGTTGFAEEQLMIGVKKLIKYHPEIHVEMVPINFQNMNQLINHEIDCTMYWKYRIDENYNYLPLFKGENKVYMNVDNPLAKKEKLTKEDLAKETFIIFRINYNEQREEEMDALNYIVSEDVLAPRRLIELNQGIVISPDGGTMLESPLIKEVPLADELGSSVEMGLVYRKENVNEALKYLLNYLENE